MTGPNRSRELTPDRQRALTLLCVFAAVVSMCTAGVLGIAALSQQNDVDSNSSKIAATKEEVIAAKTEAKVAKAQAKRTGRRVTRSNRKVDAGFTVLRRDYGIDGLPGRAGRSGREGPAGPFGPPGPGPTDEQIDAAVNRFCAAHPCGQPPTAAQVTEAIRQCAMRGECQGPAGERGESGRDGADGAPGADAPPVTDEQIDARVAAYCSDRNQCAGPPITSFTFTDATGLTQTCVDAEHDGSYACMSQPPPEPPAPPAP